MAILTASAQLDAERLTPGTSRSVVQIERGHVGKDLARAEGDARCLGAWDQSSLDDDLADLAISAIDP